MSRRALTKNNLWLVALVGAALIALLIFSLLEFARQSDLAAERREVQVVENGIQSRVKEIGGQVVPNAVWDDAVRHLDNSFDAAWAHDNIGQFFSLNGGFSFAYVLDAADRPAYAMKDGVDVRPEDFEANRETVRSLIKSVRKSEALRSLAYENGWRASDALAAPIQANSIEMIGGHVVVVTVTLVQPDFGTAKIEHQHAPVILTGLVMNTSFLDQFASRYLLSDLRLHTEPGAADDDQAHAALYGDDEIPVAELTWRPGTPGAELLGRAAPWIGGTLVIAILATLALYRLAHKATNRLLASEQHVLHLAYHDTLTGIPNRARFDLLRAEAVAHAADAPFALHCIDLDRFKDINDCYGHQVGDELLKLAAARLVEVCHPGSFCARLGGDEFVVLQAAADHESASALAHRIIATMEQPFLLSVGSKHIGCSIGIVLSTASEASGHEYLRYADLALYEAKARGRNQACFFAPEMDSELRAKKDLQEALREAIAHGDLRMVYQPQVTRTGAIVGVEALVRWRHRTLGDLSPAVFVPLAEQSGLIIPLGEFALRRAAEDSQRWPNIRVAVNVSADQILSGGFAQRAVSIVASAGASPSDIEFELTEGVLLADNENVAATLNELRDAGFSLALDDFGTGYSSLSYLRKFPISKIKIDRSFVSGLDTDRDSQAIVRAIVSLARALNIQVIAEGVETAGQWLRLSAAGCSKIQGFIASRPVDADSVDELLRSASIEGPSAVLHQAPSSPVVLAGATGRA